MASGRRQQQMARQSSDDEASTYGADSRRTRAAEPPKTRLRGLSLRKKSLRFKTDRKVPSTTALPATEVIIINSDSDEEMEGAGGVPLESCGAGVAGVVMGHDPAISVRDQFISDQMSRKSGRTALPQGVGSSARPPKRRFFLDHVAIPQPDEGTQTPSYSIPTRRSLRSTVIQSDTQQTSIASYFQVASPFMAPKTRSSTKKRSRSSSPRSSLTSSCSPTSSDLAGQGPQKKRKISHSATVSTTLVARPNKTKQATRHRERTKSSTIISSEEPTSSDANGPSSRTSSSVGVYEDVNDSDEYVDVSELDDEPELDSDVKSEATEANQSERAESMSPKRSPRKLTAAGKSTQPAKSTRSTKKSSTIGRARRNDAQPAGLTGRNKDSWKYKPGIRTEFPPIHKIGEIFDDMVHNAKELTSLDAAIEQLTVSSKGRKLRVATMCSGTESPLLALDLMASALKKYDQILEVEHVFSAEIVPFKQAYIERNFSPPVIFRDIREFVNLDENYDLHRQKRATTAYGSLVDIPRDVDVLVAGFSCVDFSALNVVSTRELFSPGESGDTFKGVLQYAVVFRPEMVVLENVYNAPWPEIKAAWEIIGYAAEFVKLDTKDYYIPHTRQRGYMLCINNPLKKHQCEKSVQDWKDIMVKLKRPASSSIEAFLLPEDDPRVHRGRMELAKGLRGEDKPPREVSWTKCQGRHLDYRADLALGNNRPMTAWEDNGSCKMPDYAWGDWARAQVERIWDTLEINKLRSARRGFDCEYKTRVWDLSQNIDRFTDTTPFGITGCVTPSGLPYVTSRGGPMIGLEALAMQGIPIEKLLLTRESQKQLQDLAGNAMTSTVVGSALLAALIVGHQSLKPRGKKISQDNKPKQSTDVLCDEDKLTKLPLDISQFSSTPVPQVIASAKRSLRLCICEGPSTITRARLQRCEDCGHTTCLKCGGNPKHRYTALAQDEIEKRLLPTVFEDQLKESLPMRVTIAGLTAGRFLKVIETKAGESCSHGWKKTIGSSAWQLYMSTIIRALGEELRFSSLVRGKIWTAQYESLHSRLELAITPYEAEWYLFAKAEHPTSVENFKAEDQELQELLLQPFARMKLGKQGLLHGNWQIRLPIDYQFTMEVKGKGTLVPAWESGLGLQEPEYIDKQVWSMLSVSLDRQAVSQMDVDISGDYQLLSDCGKASESLHKRVTPDDIAPVFLFLDPTRLGDPKLDRFVFSNDIRRLEFGQTRYVFSQIAPKWRPNSCEGSEFVNCEVHGQWIWYPEALLMPESSAAQIVCAAPAVSHKISFDQSSCGAANTVLSCKVPIINRLGSGWVQGQWMTVDKVNERSFFASFAWLTEKIRKVASLGDWKSLSMPRDYVQCQRCAPDSPVVKWKTQKQKLVPFEDPQLAAPYERALKNRPSAFVTLAGIDEDGNQLLKIGLNVSSLIHRALSNLGVTAASSGVTLAWRLKTDYVASSQPSFPHFKLPDNKSDPPSNQPPSFQVALREEQLKSLNWMISQESSTIKPFEEEEVEEALLPHMGWLAEASARKEIVARGGVLADAVGYGKTATTLGLIDSQHKHQPKELHRRKGKISIKATLIVVPGHLVQQWVDEIGKFFEAARYSVLKITSQVALNNCTIEHFTNADIIVMPWKILTGPTYLANLAKFASVPEMPTSAGRAFKTWYAYALERVNSHVDILRDAGPEVLAETLRETHAEGTMEDELNSSYVPSKRLRGKEYLTDVAARRAADSSDSPSSEPGLSTATIAGNGRKTKSTGRSNKKDAVASKGRQTKNTGGPDTKKAAAVLPKLSTAGSWTEFRCPLLQFFRFHRLVVDEYTYLEEANHASVISLQADMRWVLSGTPSMGDFADIKKIACFLNINLGINDDSVGVTRGSNIKEMEKERTDSEKFRSFQELHSPDWHEHRHEVAQQFLDRFVRQNVADIDDIQSEESYRPYHLPAAQRAIYLELHSHLMAQDMKIRKGRTKFDGDREKRMYQTLGDSRSPEEALLKRCSHFAVDAVNGSPETAMQACDQVVQQRQDQLEDLKRDLAKHLKHAVWLKAECGDEDKHYAGWKTNVSLGAFGDEVATDDLLEAIDVATDSYNVKHGKQFYSALRETQKVEKAKLPASEKALPKKRGSTTKQRKVAKQNNSYSEEDNDCTAGGSTESEKSLPLPLETKQQKIQALRNLTDHLRRLSIELVSRTRSLRFFQAVQVIQKASSEAASGDSDSPAQICCKCLKTVELQDLTILTLCGHKACHDCLKLVESREKCVVDRCKASARDFQIIRATELGVQDNRELEGGHLGKKLEEVIKLIKKTRTEEQVLLFVQFDDLLEKVASALREYGISHHLVKESNARADKIIADFQANGEMTKKKVLILNMAKESASGANLTNANHVIFLSPVLTDDQYGYDSSKAQAIGRAKRYGQTRTVKIYHFLALNTIDVDILQAREHKKLVHHGNEWKLVEKTSSLEFNGTTIPVKDLPDYGGRLPKNHSLFNEDF